MPHAADRPPEYNVVVVGGGPAGSTAGMILAKNDFSVAILDKARFPRDKPCAGLISPRGVDILAALHGAELLPRLARASTTGCRMFYRQDLVGEATDAQPSFVVARADFDSFLLQAAKDAGCAVFEEARAIEVEPDQGAVTLASGNVIRGAIVIGADGANSIVRRTFWPARKGWKKKMGFGLVADAPLEQVQSPEMRAACARFPHIFFGLIPWGYGWIFPKGDVVSVGLGTLLKRRDGIRNALRTLVEQQFRPGTWQSLRARGHLLPVGNRARAAGRDNILLTGDAAGLVEPVTGEGIAFALESARLAAAAAIESLSEGRPEKAGGTYAGLLRRKVLRHFTQASLARWFLFSKPCLPLAMRSLRRHPRLVRNYLELLSGKMSYLGYLRRMVLRF